MREEGREGGSRKGRSKRMDLKREEEAKQIKTGTKRERESVCGDGL